MRQGETANFFNKENLKYKNMPIFQDKVDKANEVLKMVGPPKEALKSKLTKNCF